MGNSRWKKTERAIASIIGGQRVPVTGRQRGDVPDVAHPWLSIECKHRSTIPAWLTQAIAQARAAARGDQLPIVVLHQHGAAHASDLVVMRLSDFCDSFGPCGAEAAEEKEG